ncbi:MAG TPA: Hsp20/alpha crystallin family protein, partial [Blastocatellia bacterium]|nr:Hsp20/alpha crystallin family protein [Blastocatellia bacterium]
QRTVAPSPIFVEAEALVERMKEFYQAVSHRAYCFFVARRRQLGHDLEDWLRAEAEVMRPVPTEIKENAEQIMVRAEVPGFSAENIEISVEPTQVILSGAYERKNEEETEKKVFSEFRGNHFYRKIFLNAEVDPAKAAATLKDGILEITLIKAERVQAVNVEVKAA